MTSSSHGSALIDDSHSGNNGVPAAAAVSSPAASGDAAVSHVPVFPLPTEQAYLLLLRLTDFTLASVDPRQPLPDAALCLLHAVYGSTLEKAAGIVDVEGVLMLRGDRTGRFFFQVDGSEARPYTCTLHHCSCPAFTNSVLLKPDAIYVSRPACCKHQLAARLASALGRCRERRVTEDEFDRLLQEDRHRQPSDAYSSSSNAPHVWTSRY